MARPFVHCLTSLGVLLIASSAWASPYPVEEVLPADAATKLKNVGVKTTSDLLKRGARPVERAKLAKATGLTAKQLTDWVRMSDMFRIVGVGPEMVRLLGAAGVDTVAKLQRQAAAQLHPKLMKINAKTKISENPPSQQHLTGWIAQAKKLKVVVR